MAWVEHDTKPDYWRLEDPGTAGAWRVGDDLYTREVNGCLVTNFGYFTERSETMHKYVAAILANELHRLTKIVSA